ncbi:MAG: L-aspartate oxidase [Dehalococcoidia bacterium]|nr:L-aspartate oxidase [Dehalococcoidia bacterium]
MLPAYDYVIIGSGIAGLFAALTARDHGSVLIVTKGSIDECNTKHAQGGIAAPVGIDDSPALHLQDTIAAGAGLVNEEAARILTEEATDRIADLVRFGVPFDSVDGEVALGREGAHSRARVLHAGGDSTGAHIELSLSSLARMSRITVLEYCLAEEILLEDGCVRGVRALDARTHSRQEFECRHLILATGGCGHLYKVSTNPDVATADGVALAYRAGAEITDMEFIQFHPTALRMPGVPPFLISEAVRGEGGVLRNRQGEPFMAKYHPQKDLAPRDIVARAILRELTHDGSDHVFLDVTHLPPQKVSSRFPQIYRFCHERGLDITKEPIPVSPAAHYMMGGVRTNTWGETNLRGLYACGEVACTGVHGANRLASNSLLETVVFAKRAVERTLMAEAPAEPRNGEQLLPEETATLPTPEPGEPPRLDRSRLQALMWEDVGIVRCEESLRRARATLSAWAASLAPPADRPSHELANLLLAGRLVTEAALLREESRGAHYRTDFPEPRDCWRRHIVFRKDG